MNNLARSAASGKHPRALTFNSWCLEVRGVNPFELGTHEDFEALEQLYKLEDEWEDACNAADFDASHRQAFDGWCGFGTYDAFITRLGRRPTEAEALEEAARLDIGYARLELKLGHVPTDEDRRQEDARRAAEAEREQEESIRRQVLAEGGSESDAAQEVARRRWMLGVEAEVLASGRPYADVGAALEARDPKFAEARRIEAIKMCLDDGVHQLSVAEAFAEWAPDVRWADDSRQWLAYDGARYRPSGDASVMARFNLLGAKLDIKAGVKGLSDLFYGDAAGGVINRAKSVVSVRASDFDRNQKELVFRDVRLDLESGAVRSNGPDSLVTRALPWKHEPATDESRAAWRAFLAGTGLAPDVIAYLQRGFGAAATGLCSEKAFFYLYGESGTAKTTFVELIARALDCYCARVSSKLFMTRRKDAGGHTDDFMSLPGARLAWCDETKEGDRFDPELVKNMTAGTGTAVMRLSAKGQPGRDVRVSFLTVFTSEHLVRVDSEDKGLFARQKIVKFQNVIPEDRRDPRFVEKNFDSMRPAIVEWLVDGARTWLASGLGPEPAAIRQAGAENQIAQDWVGAIVDELYERTESEGDQLSFAVIRTAVANHLKVAGRHATVSDNKLGRVLTKRGFGTVERTKARTRIRPRPRH